ncbi:phosphoadenosine phosphosulfate reductase family protein [Achromobacter sp. DH1f]|uniref:phosphoadenosine phosphosulfate reductase domain-containing protein n=1 Tax=Achromobacter sp. DH1f TaxID=1397275 RepID=UPI0018E37527|nr:phosphoadenosine phosphosulfate reductase family protein [Achromobacter sp. DH1f]
MTLPSPEILELISRGALFVVNHSGGKDSQAMYLVLRAFIPASQMVIVHADLGAVEWAGAVDHIKATTTSEPLHICRSRRTLLQMIEERGMFPSPQQRQCTSDLKRGPIERTIRTIVEIRIKKWVGRGPDARIGTQERADALAAGMGLIVNCMGMRAEESSGRAKLTPFKLHTGNSKAGREWYDWLPIHEMLEDQVYRSTCRACAVSAVFSALWPAKRTSARRRAWRLRGPSCSMTQIFIENMWPSNERQSTSC